MSQNPDFESGAGAGGREQKERDRQEDPDRPRGGPDADPDPADDISRGEEPTDAPGPTDAPTAIGGSTRDNGPTDRQSDTPGQGPDSSRREEPAPESREPVQPETDGQRQSAFDQQRNAPAGSDLQDRLGPGERASSNERIRAQFERRIERREGVDIDFEDVGYTGDEVFLREGTDSFERFQASAGAGEAATTLSERTGVSLSADDVQFDDSGEQGTFTLTDAAQERVGAERLEERIAEQTGADLSAFDLDAGDVDVVDGQVELTGSGAAAVESVLRDVAERDAAARLSSRAGVDVDAADVDIRQQFSGPTGGGLPTPNSEVRTVLDLDEDAQQQLENAAETQAVDITTGVQNPTAGAVGDENLPDATVVDDNRTETPGLNAEREPVTLSDEQVSEIDTQVDEQLGTDLERGEDYRLSRGGDGDVRVQLTDAGRATLNEQRDRQFVNDLLGDIGSVADATFAGRFADSIGVEGPDITATDLPVNYGASGTGEAFRDPTLFRFPEEIPGGDGEGLFGRGAIRPFDTSELEGRRFENVVTAGTDDLIGLGGNVGGAAGGTVGQRELGRDVGVGVGAIAFGGPSAVREGAEFAASAALDAPQNPGRFAQVTADRGVELSGQVYRTVEEDPVAGLATLAGSLVGSVGAIRGARAIGGARAARTTSFLVQPGEEVALGAVRGARRGVSAARAADTPGLSGLSPDVRASAARARSTANRVADQVVNRGPTVSGDVALQQAFTRGASFPEPSLPSLGLRQRLFGGADTPTLDEPPIRSQTQDPLNIASEGETPTFRSDQGNRPDPAADEPAIFSPESDPLNIATPGDTPTFRRPDASGSRSVGDLLDVDLRQRVDDITTRGRQELTAARFSIAERRATLARQARALVESARNRDGDGVQFDPETPDEPPIRSQLLPDFVDDADTRTATETDADDAATDADEGAAEGDVPVESDAGGGQRLLSRQRTGTGTDPVATGEAQSRAPPDGEAAGRPFERLLRTETAVPQAGEDLTPPTAELPEVGPEALPGFESEFTGETVPEVDVRTGQRPRTDVRLDQRVRTDVEARVDPRAEARVDTRFDVRPEPRTELRQEPRSETRRELRFEFRSEQRVEVDPDGDPGEGDDDGPRFPVVAGQGEALTDFIDPLTGGVIETETGRPGGFDG